MALCHRVVESLERFSYLTFSSALFVYSPKLHAKGYEWESVVTWSLDLDRAYKGVSGIQQQAENWATLQAMNLAAGSVGYIIGLFIDTYLHMPNGKSVSFFSWPELKSTAICSPPFYPSNQTDSQVTFQWETKECGRTYSNNIRLLMASYHVSALDSLSVKLNWQWVKVLNRFHTLGMHWIWY